MKVNILGEPNQYFRCYLQKAKSTIIYSIENTANITLRNRLFYFLLI